MNKGDRRAPRSFCEPLADIPDRRHDDSQPCRRSHRPRQPLSATAGQHWAHKFPVEFTPAAGRIELPMGVCRLSASDHALRIDLDGGEGADMARFRQVVADHLQRFGHRETLAFDWKS